MNTQTADKKNLHTLAISLFLFLGLCIASAAAQAYPIPINTKDAGNFSACVENCDQYKQEFINKRLDKMKK